MLKLDKRKQQYEEAATLVKRIVSKGDDWHLQWLKIDSLKAYGLIEPDTDEDDLGRKAKRLVCEINHSLDSVRGFKGFWLSEKKDRIGTDREVFNNYMAFAGQQIDCWGEVRDDDLKQLSVKYLTGEIKPPPKRRGAKTKGSITDKCVILLVIGKHFGLPWYRNEYKKKTDDQHLNSVSLAAEHVYRSEVYLAKDILPIAKQVCQNFFKED